MRQMRTDHKIQRTAPAPLEPALHPEPEPGLDLVPEPAPTIRIRAADGSNSPRRVRLRTALEQQQPPANSPAPPTSPSHRAFEQPRFDEQALPSSAPPRDVYAPIQIQLGPGARGAARSLSQRGNRRGSTSSVLVAATVKGYITRQVFQSDKVQNLIRTIKVSTE